MELIERSEFLELLQTKFDEVSATEGHSVFVSGEAGIGKTSLIKKFCSDLQSPHKVYQGTCDALFTPRPLAPILDILGQMQNEIFESKIDTSDRTTFFNRIFHELANRKETTILIVEDVHWADEATLDFIKFLARRITHLHCLLILTYRDNEIVLNHPLRHVVGQLSPDSFTRLQLTLLSREAVEKMALEKGWKGEDVYHISGGNPFYVNEILASYSIGVPDNIKDSILSVYSKLDEKTKQVWQILSVLPTGLEVSYLEKMEPLYSAAIHNCIEYKILVPEGDMILFKHELYRRTIESSLSPLVRISLNKKILDLFLENFERNNEIERIIHHAKNANEPELVVKYAPAAAKQAALVGAHIESSRLYLSAIEYYQGDDTDILTEFYEAYAYECYLTNQAKEAIIYTNKALQLWQEKNESEKIGKSLRFLSRLWWYDGNRKKAEQFAAKAIEFFEDQPMSSEKAMAFSNMSQLKMLSDDYAECIIWGEKAIAIAKELNDQVILCHALNNVGTVKMFDPVSREEGIDLLQQSLAIALENSFDEHVARAYTNLVVNAIEVKDFEFAKEVMEKGLLYCEERDLDSWTIYLLSYKAKLNLELGNWNEANRFADMLIENEDQTPIVRITALAVKATLNMRRGEKNVLKLLSEAKSKAFETNESQRILPVLNASLEYEWITGTMIVEKQELKKGIEIISDKGNMYKNSEFVFWLKKARGLQVPIRQTYEGYDVGDQVKNRNAIFIWKKLGCPYAEGIILSEGNETDKRSALTIFDRLGASAVSEKLKFEMRASGIKSIPRGIRRSTRSNSANLTVRELDILQLLKEGLQNKEIANKLFISPKTVDHHISSIFFKLEVNSRTKAVQEAVELEIIK